PQEDAIAHHYSLAQKIRWLILGRLTAGLFVFAGRVVWLTGSGQTAWNQVLLPVLIVGGLTILYLTVHRFSAAFLLQARIQFVVDILLVTWLVWVTDVIHS